MFRGTFVASFQGQFRSLIFHYRNSILFFIRFDLACRTCVIFWRKRDERETRVAREGRSAKKLTPLMSLRYSPKQRLLDQKTIHKLLCCSSHLLLVEAKEIDKNEKLTLFDERLGKDTSVIRMLQGRM